MYIFFILYIIEYTAQGCVIRMLNRCIHIVLEGILDSSSKECNGKTPLQTARTPVLDFLAAHGLNTLYHGTSDRKSVG
jgi:hypothetical protein